MVAPVQEGMILIFDIDQKVSDLFSSPILIRDFNYQALRHIRKRSI